MYCIPTVPTRLDVKYCSTCPSRARPTPQKCHFNFFFIGCQLIAMEQNNSVNDIIYKLKLTNMQPQFGIPRASLIFHVAKLGLPPTKFPAQGEELTIWDNVTVFKPHLKVHGKSESYTIQVIFFCINLVQETHNGCYALQPCLI